MMSKKKLDRWMKKTICTNCKFLRPEVWNEPVEYQDPFQDELFLVYTCKINKTDVINKSPGKECKFFVESSPYRLKINKDIYDNFVKINFYEDGSKIDRSLLEHFDGDEIIGHR